MIDEIAEIQTLARAAKVSMSSVMTRAGIAYSTWTRWKGGAFPNLKRLHAVRRALADEIASRTPT